MPPETTASGAPRSGDEPPQPAGESLGLRLRRVMRHWATGVSVLTASRGDELRGMTCNSFTSVSDDPATVLVCIRRGTRMHDLVDEAGRFAINILPEDAQPLADRYAGVFGDLHGKFDDVPHRLGETGAPRIDHALGYLDCRVVGRHPGGTHTIFVAEVEQAEVGAEDAPALLRFRSQYRSLPG